MINEAGFSGQLNNVGDLITSRKNMRAVNEIHLKYVDDLTLGEAINLPEKLVSAPVDKQQPDNFHARTGDILPGESSNVFKQLRETEEYARENDMKINYKKTKMIVFNPCTSIDFQPEFTLGGHDLEVLEEIRLLGIIVRSDLKWHSNTENLVQKSNKRLWMLRRLSKLGATREDQVDVFIKQIRSVLELAVPAWQSSISQAEKMDIERVKKSACHIILGEKYESYRSALKTLGLNNLEARRNQLCLRFGIKAEKHDKFKHWFKLNDMTVNTRQEKLKYCEVQARLGRFKKSPISFLTNILNEHYSKPKTTQ